MKFKLDLNLDDETELENFSVLMTLSPRKLANRLHLKGNGAIQLATALNDYAKHKRIAISLRCWGKVNDALGHERACDEIYKNNISPVCECW